MKLQLRGLQEEFDYPVDEEAAKSVGWHLRDPEEEPHRFPWMHIETMNNYVLFINLKALKIAYLYTDNKEQAPTRYHPEVYRVLTEWDIVADNLQNPTVDEIKTEFDISDALAQAVSSLVEELKANDENWDSWEELHYIKVYWLDGTQTFHYLDEELYSTLDSVKVVADEPDVYSEVYLGISFLREEDEGGSTTFLNLDQIALIEIPAIKFWQVACECNPDSLEIRGLSSYLPLTIHLPNSSNT